MKNTRWISFVYPALVLAFLIPVDDWVPGNSTSSTSIRQATGKAEADETPKAIQWRVLAPDNGKPFNDPFAKLTQEQLVDLSFVVRVQQLIAENKISADGIDAKEAGELVRRLTKAGIDIGSLTAQRERVQQIRGFQVKDLSRSIVESLGDNKVALTGYAIPIEVEEGQLTEFFLVPTVAACSHEDAPPRLQVVFIATEQGIATPGRRTPVRVTGRVVAKTTTRTTFNGNGRVLVHSAYAMSSPEITVFQATRNSSSPPKQ